MYLDFSGKYLYCKDYLMYKTTPPPFLFNLEQDKISYPSMQKISLSLSLSHDSERAMTSNLNSRAGVYLNTVYTHFSHSLFAPTNLEQVFGGVDHSLHLSSLVNLDTEDSALDCPYLLDVVILLHFHHEFVAQRG